jgi:hypothetical protein
LQRASDGHDAEEHDDCRQWTVIEVTTRPVQLIRGPLTTWQVDPHRRGPFPMPNADPPPGRIRQAPRRGDARRRGVRLWVLHRLGAVSRELSGMAGRGTLVQVERVERVERVEVRDQGVTAVGSFLCWTSWTGRALPPGQLVSSCAASLHLFASYGGAVSSASWC